MKDLDLICLKKAKINYKRSIWRYGEYLKPSLPPPPFPYEQIWISYYVRPY